VIAILAALAVATPSPAGAWRAVLDVAGGPLRFAVTIEHSGGAWRGRLCNAAVCEPFSAVRIGGDTVALELADYNASITATLAGDSLTGAYQNVGSRGPRTIPFRAARGAWPAEPVPAWLRGRWDAWFVSDGRASPRVFEFRSARTGLEGTIVSNNGDYGMFWGRADADSFSLAHFDGSFVYMLSGRLDGTGDTLRGLFHAGLRTQTPFVAWRATGRPHLTPPEQVTRADTTAPFRFAFPDLAGRLVTSDDARFRGKVVVVDVIGTWCPTCHDAAPTMVRLYDRYRARGLEMVALAYEVSGDTAQDAPLLRRYRDKFGIRFPLLLAGISDTRAAAATLPQLSGFTAFPTAIFLGRDGRVRRVHAGFYGPGLGAERTAQLETAFAREIERLLAEGRPD
jgi:thiol-disulfide isomerase/thioredoxin